MQFDFRVELKWKPDALARADSVPASSSLTRLRVGLPTAVHSPDLSLTQALSFQHHAFFASQLYHRRLAGGPGCDPGSVHQPLDLRVGNFPEATDQPLAQTGREPSPTKAN